MPQSLRCKLSKLRHKGQITAGEYEELIKKLGGHDREIRIEEYIRGYNQGTIDRAEELQKCREYGYNKAIDEFAKEIRDWQIDIQDNEYYADKFDFVFERIYEIAEQMKGGDNNV